MKMKILLSIIFCMSIALVNAQDSKTVATPAQTIENKNAPDIKFDIETYDFGTIKQGEKVSYDFTFQNNGKEPLIISAAQGSCGCTVPEWSKEPLVKGGKGKIHVQFDSNGKFGMQDKTVTISSNAKSGQRVLHLKGNVESPVATPAPDVPSGVK